MEEPFVVVGLDDSPSAQAALHFAARFARGIKASLKAVHVMAVADGTPLTWSPTYPDMGYVVLSDSHERRRSMQQIFDTVEPEPGWELQFLDGGFGPSLVHAAEGAELLVIGTQEHTGIARVLAGSVSHYCLSHARCPIVAVPAHRDRGDFETVAATPDLTSGR